MTAHLVEISMRLQLSRDQHEVAAFPLEEQRRHSALHSFYSQGAVVCLMLLEEIVKKADLSIPY